jgi:holo-[acyl-carrier protein] synthase
MILGVGVDIVENRRIKLELARRILSEAENEVLISFNLDNRKIEYLAGRFAAKEAIYKALSQVDIEVLIRDIIILDDDSGRPKCISPKYIGKRINISISHEREYSVAFAVVEGE